MTIDPQLVCYSVLFTSRNTLAEGNLRFNSNSIYVDYNLATYTLTSQHSSEFEKPGRFCQTLFIPPPSSRMRILEKYGLVHEIYFPQGRAEACLVKNDGKNDSV